MITSAALKELLVPALLEFDAGCLFCGGNQGLSCVPIWPDEPICLANVLVLCAWCDAERGAMCLGEYINTVVGPILGVHGEAGL